MKVTGFTCVDKNGNAVLCDAFGNNVALTCPKCKHPLLVTVIPNGRGSDKEHRAKCEGCSFEVWVETSSEENSIWIMWSDSN
jgi:transposase-like protein